MTSLIKSTDAGLVAAEGTYDRFDEAVSRFLATRKSERTLATYERALLLYREHVAGLDLDPFKADALIAYSMHVNAQRRDRGGDLANDTIRLRVNTVKALFSWLYTFGLSPLKPGQVGSLVTMPPKRKLSPRDILTEDEARRLLAAALDDRDRCLLGVMLDAGLRVSEAIGLQDEDIYPADNKYWLFVRSGKGDKSREVELPAGLYQMLARCRIKPRLFNLDRTNAWRVVQRTATRAKLDKHVTPHALRHTHAHHLRLAGWPLEAIADRLGHANLDTTKLYTRPAELAQQISLPLMPWAGAT